MVYADDIITWEPIESMLEMKCLRIVAVCKNFGFRINLNISLVF
jgi:hypothetical protein